MYFCRNYLIALAKPFFNGQSSATYKYMNKKYLYFPAQTPEIEVQLPASKSISNRALIINALAYSDYAIQNLAKCDDTDVLVKALNSNDNVFDIGAAGTSMRFLTAFLAKTVGEWMITGSERMKNRPVGVLVDALNELGARIEYVEKQGFPPLRIFGSALTGGEIKLDGSISSQYISALMMIAPYMQNGLKITLTGKIVSVPYIQMTKQIMKEFGVEVGFNGHVIEIKPQEYRPVVFRVESDWSAASYWYEILSLVQKGKIFLSGLFENSFQGDSRVASLFEQFGVHTEYQNDGVLLTPVDSCISVFEYDFVDQPDLTQTFAVTCCLKNIPFRFKGVQSLKIKETNRIEALINELKKTGYLLYEPEHGQLAWDGARCEANDEINICTYEDHRMAMAFAPVAFFRPVNIEDPEVVNKSYPGFWNDIEKLEHQNINY